MEGTIRLLPWGPAPRRDIPAPWGLDWDADLANGKVLTDAVHGDVHLNLLEVRLLDTRAMQRLRRINQLGATALVYPSATHSRFTHALGSVREAHRFVDALVNNVIRLNQSQVDFPHLLREWNQDDLAVRIGEACVLARLGALLHDVCHIAFGHTLEDDLHLLEPHDKGQDRFDALKAHLGGLWEYIEAATPQRPHDKTRLPTLGAELERLILSKQDHDQMDSNYPFVEDVVGNTICADLLDYLRRDHLFTGLPLDLGRRFFDAFYVSPSRPDNSLTGHPERLVCRIVRDGRIRNDIVTELMKHLRYRYELTERVLAHHAKLAADAAVGHLMDYWMAILALRHADADDAFDLGRIPEGERLLPVEDLLMKASPEEDESAVAMAVQSARANVEQRVRWHSDDSILIELASFSPAGAEDDNGGKAGSDVQSRMERSAGQMALRIRDRSLPKPIGHTELGGEQARWQVYEAYGEDPAGLNRRRRLERRIAAVLESPGLPVLLWVPSPKMSLKPAGVLVDDGSRVEPLTDNLPAAKGIEEQHRNLWSVSVFAWEEVSTDPLRASIALSIVADATQLSVTNRQGEEAPRFEEIVANSVSEYVGIEESELLKLMTARGLSQAEHLTFSDACNQSLFAAKENDLGAIGGPPESWWG